MPSACKRTGTLSRRRRRLARSCWLCGILAGLWIVSLPRIVPVCQTLTVPTTGQPVPQVKGLTSDFSRNRGHTWMSDSAGVRAKRRQWSRMTRGLVPSLQGTSPLSPTALFLRELESDRPDCHSRPRFSQFLIVLNVFKGRNTQCGGWCLLWGQGHCPPFHAASSSGPGMGDQAGLCSGPRGQLAVPPQPWRPRRVAPRLEPGAGWGQGGLAAPARRGAEASRSSRCRWAMPSLHDRRGAPDPS